MSTEVRILLVSVPQVLADPLRAALGGRHYVEQFAGDPRDPQVAAIQAACDVVIHGGSDDDAEASEQIDLATLGTWNLMTTTAATRYLRLSTMRLFDTYDPGWHVTEKWAPRPSAEPQQLAAHLAEVTTRELARATMIDTHVLRLDEVVDAARFDAGPVLPTWLHVDDAVRAIVAAVELDPPPAGATWRAWHVVRGTGRYPLAAAAQGPLFLRGEHHGPPSVRPRSAPQWPADVGPLGQLPSPERLTIFGAGGPLGSITASTLADGHVLRLSDTRPLAELAARPLQSPGAPPPVAPEPPHEEMVVDVTDLSAVQAAAQGADCLINCAVVRTDPATAFRVNVLGAFHTMRAAVDHGVGRVVHTGPTLVLPGFPNGYLEDRDVAEAAPPRAGANVYFLTKLLGQEITRIVAQQHRIASPILLFCGFVEPTIHRDRDVHSFSVSWQDAGRAMAAAATVATLPSPSPVIHVLAPSPHGRYLADTAREVLGWEARDRLDRYWYRH